MSDFVYDEVIHAAIIIATLYITGATHNFIQVGSDTVFTVGRDRKTHYDPVHGITLHIPSDSLPHGTEEIEITIKVGFTDHHLSADMIMCNATVALQCVSHEVLFTKDVFLEIPHSVSLEDTSDLCFVKFKNDACETDYGEVYNGIFPIDHPYGVIMIKSLSSFVIVKGKRFLYSQSSLRKSHLPQIKKCYCKLLSMEQSKEYEATMVKHQTVQSNLFWLGIKKISAIDNNNIFLFMVAQYTPTGFYVSYLLYSRK